MRWGDSVIRAIKLETVPPLSLLEFDYASCVKRPINYWWWILRCQCNRSSVNSRVSDLGCIISREPSLRTPEVRKTWVGFRQRLSADPTALVVVDSSYDSTIWDLYFNIFISCTPTTILKWIDEGARTGSFESFHFHRRWPNASGVLRVCNHAWLRLTLLRLLISRVLSKKLRGRYFFFANSTAKITANQFKIFQLKLRINAFLFNLKSILLFRTLRSID